MNAPSESAANGPVLPPATTGRYLAVVRKGAEQQAQNWLHKKAGIYYATASDSFAPVKGGSTYFPNIGVALIDASAEQIATLSTDSASPFQSLEEERELHLIQETPCPDACTIPEDADTWGRIVTRVAGMNITGQGTRVCVLDSGIDENHPDFKGRVKIALPFDFPSAHDKIGHGTHCAGTICGPREPHEGPRYGIASDAELLVGKVFNDTGRSVDGSVIAGIAWAIAQKCDVVSMSFGLPVGLQAAFSPAYEDIAQRALAAGTLLVAAAGNESARKSNLLQPVSHPANCPSILAVGALNSSLELSLTSNAGLDLPGGRVDFAAPGVGIRSAWTGEPGVLYSRKDGTSMAVPFVSGIALLCAEANPNIRGAELAELLRKKVQRLELPARDVGAGLISAR